MTATPIKLRDGSWGARVTSPVGVGDRITITAKNGKTWTAVVARVVWRGDDGVSIVATSGSATRRSYAPRSGRRYECEECGEFVTPGTSCWETGMLH